MKRVAYILPALFLFIVNGCAQSTAGPSPPHNENIEIRALAYHGGANYVVVTHWVFSDLSGDIASQSSKRGTISLIRKAHKRGLKVWLNIRTPLKEILPSEQGSLLFELNPRIFNGLSKEARDSFLRNLEPVVLEWAKICEDEKVEIFTPVASGQLYLLLFHGKAFSWSNELLPKVKEVYSGLLVQKIDLNPETQQLWRTGFTKDVYDFDGWDYVSTDVFGTGINTYDECRIFIRDLLDFCLSLNQKYGTKGVIFGPEIMTPESNWEMLEVGTDFWGHGELSDEEMEAGKVELWKILFEETYGRVKGYSFWSWMPSFEITYFEVEAEREGQKYRDRIVPGYQSDGPLNLIKTYYLKECKERDLAKKMLSELMVEFKGDALHAIHEARSFMKPIHDFSPSMSEQADSILQKAEMAFQAGDYLLAKCYACKIYDMKEEINPTGICIDGLPDDWIQRYEPLAIDERGDVINKGEDLNSIYLIHDENNLYFMVEFADRPSPDGVCLFFDVNSDNIWDYHVTCDSALYLVNAFETIWVKNYLTPSLGP